TGTNIFNVYRGLVLTMPEDKYGVEIREMNEDDLCAKGVVAVSIWPSSNHAICTAGDGSGIIVHDPLRDTPMRFGKEALRGRFGGVAVVVGQKLLMHPKWRNFSAAWTAYKACESPGLKEGEWKEASRMCQALLEECSKKAIGMESLMDDGLLTKTEYRIILRSTGPEAIWGQRGVSEIAEMMEDEAMAAVEASMREEHIHTQVSALADEIETLKELSSQVKCIQWIHDNYLARFRNVIQELEKTCGSGSDATPMSEDDRNKISQIKGLLDECK
ncbi:MAG: hypothetical protein V1861_03945, partial [Candidatus Micrarchaeota archaeon]